jgi:ABC-type multidrug transport system fused ATPase/permease subunit
MDEAVSVEAPPVTRRTSSQRRDGARLHERSFWSNARQIYATISPPRQRQLTFLLGVMVLNAFAELCTIGAVLPLLALIARPDAPGHYSRALDALDALGATTETGRLVAATIIFCAFALAAGALRFEFSRSSFNFAYDLSHELALEMQRRLLVQPYSFHVHRHSSRLITALEKSELLAFDVCLPLMQALSAAFISCFIIAIVFFVDLLTGLAAAAFCFVAYFILLRLISTRLAANSELMVSGINERLRIVQESLGGIRDVLIDGSQQAYLAELERENAKLARARASTEIISSAPRFVIEPVAIVAIAAVALFSSLRHGGFGAALPTLGALALAAQRLLPLTQQMFRGWSVASGHLSIVSEAVDLLTLPMDKEQVGRTTPALPLRRAIVLDNVGFTYPTVSTPTLEEVSLTIPRGSMVALVGPTGSGKSTLVDIIMGLLHATTGAVRIDETRLSDASRNGWYRSIAHVPQSIFLADTSIARNIALSLPDEPPDEPRMIEAAKKAQLHDFVVSLPAGYDTYVGERGVRLSGGQRQRLGLARAIYKGAPVLILDEATNALDVQTEEAVIGALDELRRDGRTIIIVAHRRSTVRHCNLVARLEHGRLLDFGPVDEVLARYDIIS